MLDYLWLIPLLPLAGSALNGLAGKRLGSSFVTWVGCGSAGLAFLAAAAAVLDLVRAAPQNREVLISYFTWIACGDFVAEAQFLLDPLSGVMILVVTGVGFVIHVYSIGYMHGDGGYYRFFSYMNLFLFAMLVLVMAGNFLMMFVGWEGVGLCSYLLIGYYIDRKSAGDAGKKAFVVNRIGDVGFILGVFLVFATFGSLDFAEVFRQIASAPVRFPAETGVGLLTAIALLLFVGAIGKSAQIPLYVWLPDAMEGPTPVSALIHAATMVTAGVYMVVRCAPIYSRSEAALGVVTVVGILTAWLAATIGLTQTDIKRVLAYSTVSQLGYMFVAAGVTAFSAGIFHLMTHAFFKALLFLGAGSVIHAMGGEQDLTRMGGLRRYAPITYRTMCIAALAISGIFPLAGFFSKDEILFSAWAGGHPVVWAVGLATAGLTAFYMFRLTFLAFHGPERFGDDVRHHLHESPPSMTIPLVILAILATVGGFVGLPPWMGLGPNRFAEFLAPALAHAHRPETHEISHSVEFVFALVSVLAALIGIFLARYMYVGNPAAAGLLAARARGPYTLLYRKYYVDEIYDRLLVNPIVVVSREMLWKGIDVGIVDGTVNGVGASMRVWGGLLKYVQNGLVRSYASWILTGAALLLYYVARMRG
ncbi:MAG: NADH-quinone oxidoreductase subunit L [Acidobacteria bacterium]|nr:NADH-quinone oxidoreductase subunit L [Acidobacteriota bacterium]